MRVLVTGASGFVGRAVLNRLAGEAGWHVRAATRRGGAAEPGIEWVAAGALAADGDWRDAVRGVDAVVHLAARVHVMRDTAAEPLAQFRRVNVDGSVALARQAVRAGVRRFVYVSSVKVHGERTDPGRPFRADDAAAPQDPYAASKAEAEAALADVAAGAELELVIVRPVLVYGPGVRANFRALLEWVRRGVPLPLGAVHNRRSLVASANLADLLVRCAAHPAAARQAFLASDGVDLSTAELLRRAGAALGTPARLVPVPPAALRAVGRLAGQGAAVRRLCDSLQVDIAKTRNVLGWEPPLSPDAALLETARHLLAEDARR